MLKLKQDCLFENAKQVFKTAGLSKCDTDDEMMRTIKSIITRQIKKDNNGINNNDGNNI